ncbi:MAG: hypothetical protein WD046_10720 [Paracoccaceae bacterium]
MCAIVFVALTIIFKPADPSGGTAAAVNAPAAQPQAPDAAATPEVQPAANPAVAPSAAQRQLAAFERNAMPFNMPISTRGLAVILVAPVGFDLAPLAGLPLTVAIDPVTQGQNIGAYRAYGFEVLTLLRGGIRDSVPDISQAIATMTGSVGVFDEAISSNPAANITLLSLLGEYGLAYVGQTGFGGILGQVGEAGLPAMSISATVSSAMSGSEARLALDNATRNALETGNQVVVVQMDNLILDVLLSWASTPKPRGLVLAPVSAVLRQP